MKNLLIAALFLNSLRTIAQSAPADVLLVGSDHLNQVYKKDYPSTDVLTREGQREIAAFNEQLLRYQPDVVMVEELPEEQPRLDSLYQLYQHDKLDLTTLAGGRSEVYQIAFAIANKRGLARVVCVNAPGGTSQSLLDNGQNIELYQAEGAALRQTVEAQNAALRSGKLKLREYLTFLNQPATYGAIYHLRYITPARVRNGRFRRADPAVDTAFVNPRYIGAELTAVWKRRDYQIYANIVAAQLQQQKAQRMLLIIGAAHLGSLRSIFRDDPAFTLHDATDYLR